MWFNKTYKIKHLKPNYINIKINGKKAQALVHQLVNKNFDLFSSLKKALIFYGFRKLDITTIFKKPSTYSYKENMRRLFI
jgi:hypothetical protein